MPTRRIWTLRTPVFRRPWSKRNYTIYLFQGVVLLASRRLRPGSKEPVRWSPKLPPDPGLISSTERGAGSTTTSTFGPYHILFTTTNPFVSTMFLVYWEGRSLRIEPSSFLVLR